MGLSDVRTAGYQKLTPGNYNFEVQEIDVFGGPDGYRNVVKTICAPSILENDGFGAWFQPPLLWLSLAWCDT